MAASQQRTVAPELKLAAQILLESEKKLEKLQEQIDALDRAGSPAPHYTPNGTGMSQSKTYHRQQLVTQQNQITASTLGLVNDLKKNSTGKTEQDVEQIKTEWLIDIEPAKEGEDQNLRKKLRDMGRMQSDLWRAAEMPANPQNELEQHKEEIVSKQPSVMDRARGLRQEYAHLDPQESNQSTSKETPGKDDVTKEEGPDLEPGED